MRKLFLVLLTAVMMCALQSCESCSTPSENGAMDNLVYDVTAKAEGQVEFNWFNGGATVDGNATLFQCNDTTKMLTKAASDAMPLSSALESENPDTAAKAKEVSDFITVNGVAGNYHLSIKGYVKYGPMVFMIDEEYPKDSVKVE
jgi:hypothetical protein